MTLDAELGLTIEVSGPVADWRGLERHRGWRLESWGVERQELSGGQRALSLVLHHIPPRILNRNAPGKSMSRARLHRLVGRHSLIATVH